MSDDPEVKAEGNGRDTPMIDMFRKRIISKFQNNDRYSITCILYAQLYGHEKS